MDAEIGSDEVKIRDAKSGDLPRLLEIYNYYVEHTSITFDTMPLTLEERTVWFEDFDLSGSGGLHRLFVGESAGEVVGYASSRVFRAKAAYGRSVETSIYLAADSTGAGFGHTLYAHLICALEAAPGAHRAYAGITLPNEASVALHRRLGFREVAKFSEVGFKFDRYWDVIWFERAV